jgi:hypothetical protein
MSQANLVAVDVRSLGWDGSRERLASPPLIQPSIFFRVSSRAFCSNGNSQILEGRALRGPNSSSYLGLAELGLPNRGALKKGWVPLASCTNVIAAPSGTRERENYGAVRITTWRKQSK